MHVTAFRSTIFAGALLLAGCGFQPLYTTAGQDQNVSAKLATVDVVEQKTRLGQLVRNEIVSKISPAGTYAQERYRLELAPTGRVIELIEGSNSESLRNRYTVRVAFTLYDNSTAKPVFAGKTFSQVSYDRVISPVANVQARQNAQVRAAKEVGIDIHTRLAAYLSQT